MTLLVSSARSEGLSARMRIVRKSAVNSSRVVTEARRSSLSRASSTVRSCPQVSPVVPDCTTVHTCGRDRPIPGLRLSSSGPDPSPGLADIEPARLPGNYGHTKGVGLHTGPREGTSHGDSDLHGSSTSRARAGEAGENESIWLILAWFAELSLVAGHGWSGCYSCSLGEVVDGGLVGAGGFAQGCRVRSGELGDLVRKTRSWTRVRNMACRSPVLVTW